MLLAVLAADLVRLAGGRVLSPWLPFANAAALLSEHGLFIGDPDAPLGPADTVPGFEVGHGQAAVLLTVYALAALGAALRPGWAPRRPGSRPARR